MTQTQDIDDQPAASNQSAELALAGIKMHFDAVMGENERLKALLEKTALSWRETVHSGRARTVDNTYGLLDSLNSVLDDWESKFSDDD